MSKGRHIGRTKKHLTCEECGGPLFRRKGKLVCDYCLRKEAS